MHPIVNVFLVRFQTVTLQTQRVEITLVQRCFRVVTLKQHRIRVISTPCVCVVLIWTPIAGCLWAQALYEKCPNMEFFLVCIFPHSDWIQTDTLYLSVFSPNAGKYGPEKTPYLDTFHTVRVTYVKVIPLQSF